MFLKNAKRSMTTTLTFSYALSTIILLAIVSFFSYWGVINITYKVDERVLTDQINAVQMALTKNPHNLFILKQHVVDIPKALFDSAYRFYIKIIDKDGKVMIHTPGSEAILKNTPTFAQHNQTQWLKLASGEKFLIKQEQLNSANHLTIQIAMNISYQDQLIEDYINKVYSKLLLIVFLISASLAIFFGLLVAHRGLKKLYEMAEHTNHITVSSLHQRLNPDSWPKELNALGRSFNQMLDRIESSFARLKQFSADLAHELRTPINNLMGQTEIMLSRDFSISEYKHVLESNIEELHRVSKIIENILFLATLENNQLDLPKTTIDIHQEISIIREYYQVMADEKNITISQQGIASIQVNAIMFKRAISNLLTNALKYTSMHGTIHFDIGAVDEHSVEIRITDNGIGISEEHLSKLGSRFYRVNTDRAQESGGFGLGLAIVKSIIALHKGTMTILSKLHQGTTVILILPK